MTQKNRGDSNQITRDYMDSLLIKTRYIGAALPDTSLELYGETFGSPIMTAAYSHLDLFYNAPNGMEDVAKAAHLSNMVAWAGMGDKEELRKMIATGARVIKIIKPYADEALIFEQIRDAEELGAFAVGMDIDHSFTANGEYDVIFDLEMRAKTATDIQRYVQATRLPFILKGVLSVPDAISAKQAGAKGIVVSHHHGNMDYAVPPLLVLPEIVKALDGEMPIFVDCNIESGADAFKALALGATAVCAGRGTIENLALEGAEGVRKRLVRIEREFAGYMARTGTKNLASMDSSVIV